MAFRDDTSNSNRTAGNTSARRPDCLRCDDLLADAVDELLEPGEQAWFDRHIATCMDCQESFAEAKRGAAWLEMLKSPRPEPSAQLLERILAKTSGQALESPWMQPAEPEAAAAPGPRPFLVPLAQPFTIQPFPIQPLAPTGQALPGNVLAFRPRVPWISGVPRAVTRLLFEPRLAMTAAMAFFSIALTMNITGVRLNDLHASDLKPSSLRRSYFEATASAARHYESLRVVHVLESRADDLREADGGLTDRSGSGGSHSPEKQAGGGQSQ